MTSSLDIGVCVFRGRWEPRYFVLDGVSLTLACYKTEQSIEAESVLSLKRCVLREEGSKQGKPAGHGKVQRI